MATLELGVPLKTREAGVDGPADLPVGRYRIVLVVAGRSDKSDPAELIAAADKAAARRERLRCKGSATKARDACCA